MVEYSEGDTITVVVDGKPYDTCIIDGVQRFIEDSTNALWDRWDGTSIDRNGRGSENLNDLFVASTNKNGSFDERIEITLESTDVDGFTKRIEGKATVEVGVYVDALIDRINRRIK